MGKYLNLLLAASLFGATAQAPIWPKPVKVQVFDYALSPEFAKRFLAFDSVVMSKPYVKSIVELSLDFIVQNVTLGDGNFQCHFTDGWGASAKDPKGQRGIQDCLLDRAHLLPWRCSGVYQEAYNFSMCLLRNQEATSIINDGMKKFNATMKYCCDLVAWSYEDFHYDSGSGALYLDESHKREVKLNPNRAPAHIKNVAPAWLVNGKSVPSSADMLSEVCNAYATLNPGKGKPIGCPSALMV